MIGRWVRKDYPTIMSGLVVRYFWRDRGAGIGNEPEVNASRDGVSLQGMWPEMGKDDLLWLRFILDRAAAQHECIATTGKATDDNIERDDRRGAFG